MDKVAFARLVNLLTVWGMRELEAHEMQTLECMTTPDKTALVASPNLATVDEIANLLKARYAGQKIESIKAIRAMTGLSLKEAKDLLEANWGD